MFVEKQLILSLVAALTVQVLLVSALPVTPAKTNAETDSELETEVESGETLQTRGLWGDSWNPLSAVSDTATKTVNDTLQTAKNHGGRAVRSAAGAATELATGFNPNTYYEMSQEAMKKAIQGARYGTQVAYDATDKTLDTLQSLHDRKKELMDSYVKPNAPSMVGEVIDHYDNGFDSTMATIKGGVQKGRAVATSTLDHLEQTLENGDSILPDAVQSGIATVGNMIGAGNWMNGSLGWAPTPAGAEHHDEDGHDEEVAKAAEEAAKMEAAKAEAAKVEAAKAEAAKAAAAKAEAARVEAARLEAARQEAAKAEAARQEAAKAEAAKAAAAKAAAAKAAAARTAAQAPKRRSSFRMPFSLLG